MLYSNFAIFKYYYIVKLEYSNPGIFKYFYIQILLYSNITIFKYSNMLSKSFTFLLKSTPPTNQNF